MEAWSGKRGHVPLISLGQKGKSVLKDNVAEEKSGSQA